MPESQAVWIKIVYFLLLTSLSASIIFFGTVSSLFFYIRRKHFDIHTLNIKKENIFPWSLEHDQNVKLLYKIWFNNSHIVFASSHNKKFYVSKYL